MLGQWQHYVPHRYELEIVAPVTSSNPTTSISRVIEGLVTNTKEPIYFVPERSVLI